MLRLLRNFLTLAIGASHAVITGTRRPLGYAQIVNLTLQAATGLVLPTQPTSGQVVGLVIIQCNGGVVRWRDDAVDPTTTVGMSIPDGGELDYVGDFSAIRFIDSSGTPILDVSYYA